MATVSTVKTIWQVDEPVNVAAFYYPQRVESKSESGAREIRLLDSGPMVVEGIAGQGKSILLRHLAVEVASQGKRLPVFLQLRHIDAKNSLRSLVTRTMEGVLGTSSPLVIEYLLRNQQLLFLLDGFDEIDTAYRSDSIRELHDFLDRYPSCPVIVSARPNSDIQNSALFTVVRIRQLSPYDRTRLIEHLVEDVDTRSRMLMALDGKEHIAGVLTTPLLVTLLIITYKSGGDIPDQLSAFYKSLFSTLLKRHDKMKPGYVRQRRTTLSDTDFESVFETLCFLTLNEYKLHLEERELESYLQASLASLNIESIHPAAYAEDLVRVTCLVIRDGDRYFFLHKSIPEYFAAQKVAEERDVSTKEDFYRQLATSEIPENWYQTIFFLGEIDSHNYVKLLLLPKLADLFLGSPTAELPQLMPSLKREQVMTMLGQQAMLTVRWASRDSFRTRLQTSSDNWFANMFLREPLEESIESYVNSLSYELGKALHDVASHGLAFSDALDSISSWQSFLTFLSDSQQLREAYARPLLQRQAIASRIRKTRPLFSLNVRRH